MRRKILLSIILTIASSGGHAQDELQEPEEVTGTSVLAAAELSPPELDENQFVSYTIQSPSSVFYAQADTMFLQLKAIDGHAVPLAGFNFDSNPEVRFPVSSLMDGRFRAVPRLVIGQEFEDQSGWELVYFGSNDWQKDATSFGPIQAQASTLSTNLQNGEANLLTSFEDHSHWKVLAGGRYLHLGEQLDLQETLNSYSANSDTSNNLIGGQIGARYDRTWDNLDFDVTGKFGVYGNLASSRATSLVYGDQPTSHSCVPSLVTDLSATMAYRVTDACSFRVGYQFLLIDGIASASGQLGSHGPFPRVVANDDVFLHGPTIGLEFRF